MGLFDIPDQADIEAAAFDYSVKGGIALYVIIVLAGLTIIAARELLK